MSKNLISELKDASEEKKSPRELALTKHPILREMFNRFAQDLLSPKAEQIPWHFLDLKIAEDVAQEMEDTKKPHEKFQAISALWKFVSDEEDREPMVAENTNDTDIIGTNAPKMSYSFIINSPEALNQLEPEACRSVTELLDMEENLSENWSEEPTWISCRYQENRERFFELLTLLSETLNEESRKASTLESKKVAQKCKNSFHFMMQKVMEKIMTPTAYDIHLVIVNFMSNSIMSKWEKYENEKWEKLEQEEKESENGKMES